MWCSDLRSYALAHFQEVEQCACIYFPSSAQHSKLARCRTLKQSWLAWQENCELCASWGVMCGAKRRERPRKLRRSRRLGKASKSIVKVMNEKNPRRPSIRPSVWLCEWWSSDDQAENRRKSRSFRIYRCWCTLASSAIRSQSQSYNNAADSGWLKCVPWFAWKIGHGSRSLKSSRKLHRTRKWATYLSILRWICVIVGHLTLKLRFSRNVTRGPCPGRHPTGVKLAIVCSILLASRNAKDREYSSA